MKRVLVFSCAFLSAALLAGGAWAEPPRPQERDEAARSAEARESRPRYAGTLERWRGRPSLRSAARVHPADASASELVYESLPSVNFMLQGQSGGAFSAPRF